MLVEKSVIDKGLADFKKELIQVLYLLYGRSALTFHTGNIV